MTKTISEALKEFGFMDSSYQRPNGFRISMYYSKIPLLYCGWQSIPSAPIIRDAPWFKVFKNYQRIRISDEFIRMKPQKLRFTIFSLFSSFISKYNPQYNHSSTLEFQNILSVIENEKQRPTKTGDVYSFDCECAYRILRINEDLGYAQICKEEDFNDFSDSRVINFDKIQILHASLFTFVDLLEILD